MSYRIITEKAVREIISKSGEFPFGNNGKKCQDFSEDMFRYCGLPITEKEYLLITKSKNDAGECLYRFSPYKRFTSDMVETTVRKRGIIRKRK